MIKIDFDKKTITHICSDNDNACGKEQTLTFDEFKKNGYGVVCTPCDKENHNENKCTHCSVSELYNLEAFIKNLEMHEHINQNVFLSPFKSIEDKKEREEAINNFFENNSHFLHYKDEILKDGYRPRHRQFNSSIWEVNRQYHILRRILEDKISYEDALKEPDMYEEMHKRVGRKQFIVIRKEHENNIRNMKEYLNGITNNQS